MLPAYKIVRLKYWEKTRDENWKKKLLQYDLEDCDALRKVVHFLRAACNEISGSDREALLENQSGLHITPVRDLDRASYTVRWQTFVNADLAFVNKHAYFDYQRQRVFLRASKTLRQRHRALDKIATEVYRPANMSSSPPQSVLSAGAST